MNFKRLNQLGKIFKLAPEAIILYGENHDPQIKKSEVQVQELKMELVAKDLTIMELQQELIKLYKKGKN